MSNGNVVIERDEAERQVGDLVSRIPKEHLKALFYLYAGKPDSRIKVFKDSVYLEPLDIVALNECVVRKLETHNVQGQVTSVTVGFVGSEVQEYGSWAEFNAHTWPEPACIEEIVVKWDFLLQVKTYEAPQRHTLMVRVSSDMKPGKFLQLLASGNSDEFEKMDVMTAPAFCRVDFINAQISKELINEVSDWYKGRRSPALIPSVYHWFKKKRNGIAMITHYSLPFMFSILWVSIYSKYQSANLEVSNLIAFSAVWMFLGIYFLQPVGKVGHLFASSIYGKLEAISGNRVAFNFTSGDKKRNSELLDQNRTQGRLFLVQTSWAMLLNVIAGVVATYLYTHS